MKIFSTSQVRQLDQSTIANEPITSINLMERAANALCTEFHNLRVNQKSICVFAGPGNNGGDALVMARMLILKGLNIKVILVHEGKLSADCSINRERLIEKFSDSLIELTNEFIAPEITSETIIIDGLFGSGLSRPLKGVFAECVTWINNAGCEVVAIDIPSGLNGEENNTENNSMIVKASVTLSLQFPKLAFFLVENAIYVGEWKVLYIGIHPQTIEDTPSETYFLEENDIKLLIKKRSKYGHKGTFGHAFIVAGSRGMAGAAILSAKAALRSGAGLVTVHSCSANRNIVQTAIPEAIFSTDESDNYISNVFESDLFDHIAVGPGIGMMPYTVIMLESILEVLKKPCILDADALNIISRKKELLQFIPQNSILTPHPKEFERLFGKCDSAYQRMKKAHEAAQELNVIIILKGAYTLIAMPDGTCFFNSTGNSGMATAGAGDVLTGILVSLLAQGYSSEDAAKIGIFLHGRAGNLALELQSEESLIASDIISQLGNAFKSIKNV